MKSRPVSIMLTRCGFTIIELLVSISIIAVLMSLILPAVSRARESARRIQCANRMRNVGVALLSYEATHRRFPAAGYWGGPDKSSPWPNHNWVVEILANLDRQDLHDRWDKSKSRLDSANLDIAETFLEVLVCPSDVTTNGRGDLSYAVNGGIGESTFLNGVHDCPVDPFYKVIDLNGNGVVCNGIGVPDGPPSDRDLFKATGLFFTENYGFSGTPGYRGTVRHHNVGSISDGPSMTLLLAENVRVGYDPFAAEPANWSSPDTRRSRVFFSHRVCQNNVCSTGQVDYSKANSGDHAINAGLIQPEGESPWASSYHSGGLNVVFADGHLTFLSEDIDGRVYASLFTPQGRSFLATPLDQGVIGTEF